MIYTKDLNIYDNHLDNFHHKQKEEKDPKYKLPYLESHWFRRLNILIDDKIQDVYLSTWNFKIRTIDHRRIQVSILEFPSSYVLKVTHLNGTTLGNTIWYEQLDHIPD